MKITQKPSIKDNQTKIWRLIQMYLFYNLIRARNAQLGYFPVKPFPINKRIINARQKQNKRFKDCYYKCIEDVKAHWATFLPFTLAAVEAYEQGRCFSINCYNNNRLLKPLKQIFKEEHWKSTRNLVSLLWRDKRISLLLKDDQLVIRENETNIIATYLSSNDPRNFMQVYSDQKSREFFGWSRNYFDCFAPSFSEQIATFNENVRLKDFYKEDVFPVKRLK